MVNSGPSLGALSGMDIKPNCLLDKTLSFLSKELPGWRDDPKRPDEEGEEKLNLQLCKYLGVRSRHEFPMAHFNHEEPQTGQRRVDISVTPDCLIVIGTREYTIYDPYLVIEGKRLPAPETARKQEYVTGHPKISGGMQRFKLGLHGKDLKTAAMVAYVQDNDLDAWLTTINGWIDGLHDTDCVAGCKWTKSESLNGYKIHKAERVSSCRSMIARNASSTPEIQIHHFWVAMRRTKKRAKKGK
jgi:hypothetical protein